MEWTINVEVAAARRLTTVDAGELLDALEPHGAGSVTVTADGGVWTATFFVDADTPNQAALAAEAVVITVGDSIPPAGCAISALTVLDDAAVARLDERERFPELVGIAELAELGGMTRQQASRLQTRQGFPAPVAQLRAGPVWRLGDITAFIESWTRKPGRPSKVSA
jgi:hypothetical protein